MTGFNIFVSRFVRALIEGKEPELPELFRWTTPDGQPVLFAELLVLRGDEVLFRKNLDNGSVEVALTQSDAPYMFLFRKGMDEEMAVGARDSVKVCVPTVLESGTLGIKLIADAQMPLAVAGRGTA